MGLNYLKLVKRMKNEAGLKNDSEVARSLRITPQAMSNFKKKGEIPTDLVIKFALIFKLSVDKLLTGEGPLEREPGGDDLYIKVKDDITDKILSLLRDMDDDQRRDVLKYAEKEKLLSRLLKENKEQKNTG